MDRNLPAGRLRGSHPIPTTVLTNIRGPRGSCLEGQRRAEEPFGFSHFVGPLCRSPVPNHGRAVPAKGWDPQGRVAPGLQDAPELAQHREFPASPSAYLLPVPYAGLSGPGQAVRSGTALSRGCPLHEAPGLKLSQSRINRGGSRRPSPTGTLRDLLHELEPGPFPLGEETEKGRADQPRGDEPDPERTAAASPILVRFRMWGVHGGSANALQPEATGRFPRPSSRRRTRWSSSSRSAAYSLRSSWSSRPRWECPMGISRPLPQYPHPPLGPHPQFWHMVCHQYQV